MLTPAATIVRVSGEIDLSTAPWLEDKLRHAQGGAGAVIVDLDQVAFMDCAGLRVLMRAHDAAPGRFSVTPGSRQVRKLFALTGAGALLHIVEPPAGEDRNAA